MSGLDGKSIINSLIKKAVGPGGYSSAADLARGMMIVPQKLNRWKNGKSAVSSEGVTLALILLEQNTAADIKELLSRQSETERMFNHLKGFASEIRNRIDAISDPEARKRYEDALSSIAKIRSDIEIARELGGLADRDNRGRGQ